VNLLLWKPGTSTVQGLAPRRGLAARSARPGSRERISGYRVAKGGRYYVEVQISKPGSGAYSLSFSRR
jgi:hypothetical protein